MPIQGEIKTLYKNKNNTSPIFPTTKVKAVSDENGIGLDALLRDNYATKTYVTSEIAKAQVGGDDSEIDLSGFATKDDVANIKHPISSVNNKTGEVILTAEDVGAAPAGYGLGGVSKQIYTSETFDNITANGWYFWNSNHPDTKKPFDAGAMLVITRISTKGTTQIAYRNSNSSIKIRHQGDDGVWEEWDWVNPPMGTNTEYRTTERIRGYAVYKRANSYERSIVQYHLDGEDKWRPYAELLGAALVTRDGLTGYSDFNNATEPGVYYCNTWAGSGGANFPNGQDSGMLIVFQPTTDSFIQQIYISDSDGIIRRLKWADEDDWKPWEYDTPPMKLGVEYRTTKRWNRKVVYTKQIDFGLSADVKEVQIYGISALFVTSGVCGNQTMPFIDDTNNQQCYINSYTNNGTAYLTMRCGANAVGQQSYVTLEYTKD